jgi:hypothetical protein
VQLLIDTETETKAGLRLAARVMLLLATEESAELDAIQDAASQAAAPKAPAPPPIGKPVAPAPAAPLPPGNVPPPPVIHPPVHPDALPKADVPTGTDIDPAALFGGNRAAPFGGTTVAPPVPGNSSVSAPPVPTMTPPSALPVTTTTVGTLQPPVAPIVTQTTNAPAPNGTGTVESQPTAQAGERDSEGLPWDARIHSETHKTNADGTWRYRRNLDAGVKAAVYAELKMTRAGEQAFANVVNPRIFDTVAPSPPAAVAPPPPATEVVAPPPPASATVLPFPAAAAPPVPVPPATDVGVSNTGQPPVVQTVTSFRDLMQKVNVALAAGKLTQPQLAEACKAAGVDSVTALAAQPMLVPTVDVNLRRWLAA